MCNNSQRNLFLMQFMLMTVSIYIVHGQFLLNFHLKRIYSIEQHIKISEKLNYEDFGITVVYYLKRQSFDE